MNNQCLNFRNFWEILKYINLTNLTYNDVNYEVIDGYIDIDMDINNIYANLMYRIHDTGSQPGDEEITINIYNKFISLL